MQLLINARADPNDDMPDHARKLTDTEVVRTALSLLLAGYETTSNALAFTSYLLAMNPEVQDKLCEEIDYFFRDKPVRYIAVYRFKQLCINVHVCGIVGITCLMKLHHGHMTL